MTFGTRRSAGGSRPASTWLEVARQAGDTVETITTVYAGEFDKAKRRAELLAGLGQGAAVFFRAFNWFFEVTINIYGRLVAGLVCWHVRSVGARR